MEDPSRSSGEAQSGGGAAAPQKSNIVFKSVDMSDEMRSHACACACAAFRENSVEKNIAEYIKKEFDARYGPSWHCIVGRNFGSFVTHEAKHFIYFYVDAKAILLFKSG